MKIHMINLPHSGRSIPEERYGIDTYRTILPEEPLDGSNMVNDQMVDAEVILILHDIGITVLGDFIVSPGYDEAQFEALDNDLLTNAVIPTRLPERVFSGRYAGLIKSTHAKAKL